MARATCNTVKKGLTVKYRAARTVENSDYAQFAHRTIRAFGRRAADDIDALPQLAEIVQTAEAELRKAIEHARKDYGYSWADIGKRLGISRQAAQQRFGSTS